MTRKLNTKQAAMLLGVDESTLRRRAREGLIPARKADGEWRFKASDLAEVRRREGPTPRPSRNIRADCLHFEGLVQEIDQGSVPSFEAAQGELLNLALSVLAAADTGANRPYRARVLRLLENLNGNPAFTVLGFARRLWKLTEPKIA